MRLIQSVLVLILSMTTFIHFAAAENEDTSNQLEMLKAKYALYIQDVAYNDQKNQAAFKLSDGSTWLTNKLSKREKRDFFEKVAVNQRVNIEVYNCSYILSNSKNEWAFEATPQNLKTVSILAIEEINLDKKYNNQLHGYFYELTLEDGTSWFTHCEDFDCIDKQLSGWRVGDKLILTMLEDFFIMINTEIALAGSCSYVKFERNVLMLPRAKDGSPLK
jgi:hypothetical protein